MNMESIYSADFDIALMDEDEDIVRTYSRTLIVGDSLTLVFSDLESEIDFRTLQEFLESHSEISEKLRFAFKAYWLMQNTEHPIQYPMEAPTSFFNDELVRFMRLMSICE